MVFNVEIICGLLKPISHDAIMLPLFPYIGNKTAHNNAY